MNWFPLYCWYSQWKRRKTDRQQPASYGEYIKYPHNENVSSRNKELVHLNDYYFVVSLAFFFSSTVIFLYFSLSHCFRPYQLFTISFKWDQMGLHFLFHGGWLCHWKLWVPSRENRVTKGRFLPLEGKAAF